jgi:hypothetical protein
MPPSRLPLGGITVAHAVALAALSLSALTLSAQTVVQNPIPRDQLTFLNRFAGAPSDDLVRDKQFRKLMHSVVPNCMFHYGRDMPLTDALEIVLKGSPLPVRIRDGRYLLVSGRSGPYLAGRGFIWIDLQDGVALGGFYFHPTNGEPTPAANIFSKQVKDQDSLKLSQLPAAFAEDLIGWSAESRIPPVSTRYFITGSNKKILLEHEDFCAPAAWPTPPPQNVCQQMNADAADIDVNAAYYLEQTHHATNATAWMIADQDQVAWFLVRDNTCRVGPDPLSCRIRMARERTRTIIQRRREPHPLHS